MKSEYKTTKSSYRPRRMRLALGPWLTPSGVMLLRAIDVFSFGGVLIEMARSEIAERMGCSPRSVVNACRELERLEFIHVDRRPGRRADRDEINRITLLPAGAAWLNRRPPARLQAPDRVSQDVAAAAPPSQTDRKKFAQPYRDSSTDSVTPSPAPPAEPEKPTSTPADPTNCLQEGNRFSELGNPVPAVDDPGQRAPAAPSWPTDGDSVRLARRAAFVLAPDWQPAAEAAFDALDRVRRQRLSKLNRETWRRACAALGAGPALLAAALALLKPADRSGLRISTPAGYLAAMLGRGATPREIRASLAAALDARDGYLTWHAPIGSMTLAPAAERPPVPRQPLAPWQRRLAARLGESSVRAWFAAAQWDGRRLVMPSRFAAGYVTEKFAGAIRGVLGEVTIEVGAANEQKQIDLPSSQT